ncbi:ubiquinol-cytochrome-c reductase complex subunit-domain-containing protein [Neohortaea acidophila]|uniref:Ubiquinol-cytochrome-c reductase complex subunit-domain-containing protein n=1 Tax=Neohortaea acidophila TaxID=245834 RepID=A0A6A6PG61_9PEZI|nr:ubiquinol-cytochrome-c reductase complex subunit-domain-containing protein [Neohortaea acidophila]KAF2478766.1 ubiquinol-cytochrome-c reductase complex subunit-domain-containing protein [Neohortaea acidophila]
MQSTLLRRAQFGTQSDGFGGVHPWQQRPDYSVFRSKYGPQYKITPHVHGLNSRRLVRYGIMSSLFGVSAGVFALFFFNGIPRVRQDILEQMPFIGDYFHHEIPPEDDPF